MTTTDPDQNRGLYGRYRVEKVMGKPTGPAFVLAFAADRHARVALTANAESCREGCPQLADDLLDELHRVDRLT